MMKRFEVTYSYTRTLDANDEAQARNIARAGWEQLDLREQDLYVEVKEIDTVKIWQKKREGCEDAFFYDDGLVAENNKGEKVYVHGEIRVQFKGEDDSWYENAKAYQVAIRKGITNDAGLKRGIKEWGNNN